MLSQLFFASSSVHFEIVERACAWALVLWFLFPSAAVAVEPGEIREQSGSKVAAVGVSPQSAVIHWSRLPLRDAVDRLEEVFGQVVFVDRRVDTSQRVNLDIEATAVADVLSAVAAPRGLGVASVGPVVYLGPRAASEAVIAIVALRSKEIDALTASQGAALERRLATTWPRLAEPRELVAAAIGERGWQVAEVERIPHDLWPAGALPALPLSEQLTLLLIGFDLSFEVHAKGGVVAIVSVDAAEVEQPPPAKSLADAGPNSPQRKAKRIVGESRRLYTLRVEEQPVRAVLGALRQRLDWEIEIDEAAIRAAGLSADKRVSFAVENAEQDALLAALLRPAGLMARRDGERIVVGPRVASAAAKVK